MRTDLKITKCNLVFQYFVCYIYVTRVLCAVCRMIEAGWNCALCDRKKNAKFIRFVVRKNNKFKNMKMSLYVKRIRGRRKKNIIVTVQPVIMFQRFHLARVALPFVYFRHLNFCRSSTCVWLFSSLLIHHNACFFAIIYHLLLDSLFSLPLALSLSSLFCDRHAIHPTCIAHQPDSLFAATIVDNSDFMHIV